MTSLRLQQCNHASIHERCSYNITYIAIHTVYVHTIHSYILTFIRIHTAKKILLLTSVQLEGECYSRAKAITVIAVCYSSCVI